MNQKRYLAVLMLVAVVGLGMFVWSRSTGTSESMIQNQLIPENEISHGYGKVARTSSTETRRVYQFAALQVVGGGWPVPTATLTVEALAGRIRLVRTVLVDGVATESVRETTAEDWSRLVSEVRAGDG